MGAETSERPPILDVGASLWAPKFGNVPLERCQMRSLPLPLPGVLCRSAGWDRAAQWGC